jgi:hypothetical protein
MSQSERRPISLPKLTPQAVQTPTASWIAQQRREEYRVAPLVQPIVESAVASVSREKAAEEAAIRKQLQDQVAAAEAEARRKFESDLAAQKAQAKADFEAGLTAEKSKDTFNQQLAEEEARQRSVFKADLAARRQAFLGGSLGKAKLEYQMRYGQALDPRAYRAAESSAAAIFAGLAQPEGQQFEQSLTAWKQTETEKRKKEAAEWEAQQRSAFEEELKPWESESRATLEAQLSTWKAGEAARFEGQIGEWGKTWQAKGLAEHLMDIKVPSLDLSGKLSEALGIEKYPKITPYGVKIGKTLFTPEGAEPYKLDVAPLALPAAIIGSVESLAYPLLSLAGVPTPRTPPTLVGGLLSSAIMSGMKRQFVESPEMKRLRQMGISGDIYGVGTIVGDVLVSLGISKAVKVGGEAIKDIAGFVYEGSGLKYSHALYEASGAWRGFQEKLPLWLTSPREAWKISGAAKGIHEGVGDLRRALLGVKYSEVGGELMIGLPTLPEAEKGAEEFLVKGAKVSKALETAKAIGLTPLEYEKALYPKVFAGMELLGWAKAPETAAFGLTVPLLAEKTGKAAARAGTSLADALAETMWITAPAAERWAARAGVMPSLEEVIVGEPQQIGEKMIKGGRFYDISLSKALGFSKFPYKEAAAGRYFFEKEKLPSLKDLLKAESGEVVLAELVTSPANVISAVLPKLAVLPEAAAKVAPETYMGLAAIIGVKAMPKAPTREKQISLGKSLISQILKPEASVKSVQRGKLEQPAIQAQALVSAQLTETLQALSSPSLSKMYPTLPPSRRKDEGLRLAKKIMGIGKLPKRRMAGFLYPILPEEKVPKFLTIGLVKPSRKAQSISIASYLLGKKRVRKSVSKPKARHKRK